MDFGQVIYVIVIVLYFIYRAVAKKKGEEVTSEEESDSIPPKKGPSFEELLKEIREAQLPSLVDYRTATLLDVAHKGGFPSVAQKERALNCLFDSEGLSLMQGFPGGSGNDLRDL